MQSVGIPTIEWSGSGLQMDTKKRDGVSWTRYGNIRHHIYNSMSEDTVIIKWKEVIWIHSNTKKIQYPLQSPIVVPKELIEKACVNNINEGLEAMQKHKIGYPMMVRLFSHFSRDRAAWNSCDHNLSLVVHLFAWITSYSIVICSFQSQHRNPLFCPKSKQIRSALDSTYQSVSWSGTNRGFILSLWLLRW